jgi:uncharacterized membrane protein
MNKGRVESFSDGVFGFAITLLVVTIAEPGDYRHLAQNLGQHWPSLAAYVVSFAIIGIMWLNHHSVFSHFEKVDRNLIYLNLLLLMTVAFLPYPTGVLGQALARGVGERTAAVVYGTTMALNGLAWAGLWLYSSRGRRLLVSSFPEDERHTATLLFTAGALVYAAAVGLAFVNAYAFLVLQAALACYYALDPLSRRVERARVTSPAEETCPSVSPSPPPSPSPPSPASPSLSSPALDE